MKLNRRRLLTGAGAVAAYSTLPKDAKAWLHPGQQLIGHGWNNLPLGAGGFVTGFDLTPSGALVCRTDVGNIYRWTGTSATTTNPNDRWLPLLNLPSLAGLTTNPRQGQEWGGLEIVQAPSDPTKIWAIFDKLDGTINASLFYSTDSGNTWDVSNLNTIQNAGSNTPSGYSKLAYYRIMVDPNNSSVVYFGAMTGSGLANAVYVATDGQTFNAVGALGTTAVGPGAIGMCFDASSGTVTGIGSLTVTKRAIIPVCGNDIFKTTDGGVTWTSTGAATAFGTTNFSLNCGVIDSNGVYYCVRNDSGAASAVWRYTDAGGWVQILSLTSPVPTGAFLIFDPADPGYLSVTGDRGIAYGSTSLNADTGSPPTWTSTTGTSSSITATAPAYDLPWLKDIFDQGGPPLTFGMDMSCGRIDAAGNTIFCGNQSIWILSGRPVYNGATNFTLTSFGRGQDATVAQEVWKPTGGNNPLIAVQDFGTPIGGTFTKFPTAYSPPFKEFTCSSIEESPTDGTFCVFRITGQGGNPAEAPDSSGYSTDASANVTPYASNPSAAWRGTIHGSITSAVLTVTSVDTGVIFIGQQIFDGSTNLGVIGSGISVNPDGTGTYNVTFGAGNDAGPTLQLYADNIAGQIIAVDNNRHLIVAAGHSHGCIPIQTQDQGNTWALCNGLPSSNWLRGAWFAAPNSKPMAVGFGTDVGIAWAMTYAGTTLTIYKSTDGGQNFNPTLNTITVGASVTSVYLLAVSGHPGHLWAVGSSNGGGLWQSTDYGDTWTQKTSPPGGKIGYVSIGAIEPVTGTYPTIWATCGNAGDPTVQASLYYSIDGATTWTVLGSHGASGVKPDLPTGQQMYGLGAVRADRQVFSLLYCGAGQMGFCYYGP